MAIACIKSWETYPKDKGFLYGRGDRKKVLEEIYKTALRAITLSVAYEQKLGETFFVLRNAVEEHLEDPANCEKITQFIRLGSHV